MEGVSVLQSSEKQAPSMFSYVYMWASTRVDRRFLLLKIEINDELFLI